MRKQEMYVRDYATGESRSATLYLFSDANDFMRHSKRFIERGVELTLEDDNKAVKFTYATEEPFYYYFARDYLLEYANDVMVKGFSYLYIKKQEATIKAEVPVCVQRVANNNGKLEYQEYTGPLELEFNLFSENNN